jgi:hypothetical protein
MTDHDALVDRYIAAWNELDPTRRRELIARTWTEEASYLDPKLSAQGHAALEAMLQGVQGMFPGHRFRRLGAAEAHHDRLRFRWALEAAGGRRVVEGTDIAVLAPDGRMASVTGFFDAVRAG